jgi:hypothetical protein
MAGSRFEWYEKVRVVSMDPSKASISGEMGAILGKAQGDDGRWSYGVFIYNAGVVWSCWEDELTSTGEFDRRESFFGNQSRDQVVDVLQLLASEERQLAYERDVPHVDVTAELVCLWFDDTYHADNAAFRASFTTDELAALAAFNALLDEQRLRLPESEGTIRTWLASPEWRDIMRMAEQTLQRLAD